MKVMGIPAQMRPGLDRRSYYLLPEQLRCGARSEGVVRIQEKYERSVALYRASGLGRDNKQNTGSSCNSIAHLGHEECTEVN